MFILVLDDFDDKYVVGVVVGLGIMLLMVFVYIVLFWLQILCFMLLYMNWLMFDVMFLEDFVDFKDCYFICLILYYVLFCEQWMVLVFLGWLDEIKLCMIFGFFIDFVDVDEWFLCGLFVFVDFCWQVFVDVGVLCEYICFELFIMGDELVCVVCFVMVCFDEKIVCIEVNFDGVFLMVESLVVVCELVLNVVLCV